MGDPKQEAAAELERLEQQLDSPESELLRQHPLYLLLRRLDDFLHELCGNEEADKLHADVHEAAFHFVTKMPVK